MISFNDGDMKFDESELNQVAADAHSVTYEAIEAGIWIFGGGFAGYSPWVVRQDHMVEKTPLAESSVVLGGFCIIDVEDDETANFWAQKIGVACRCDQEVRKFMDDPDQDAAMARKR